MAINIISNGARILTGMSGHRMMSSVSLLRDQAYGELDSVTEKIRYSMKSMENGLERSPGRPSPSRTR